MNLKPINTVWKETTTRVLFKDVPRLAQFFYMNIYWTKHDWSIDGLTGAEAFAGWMTEDKSRSKLFDDDTEVLTVQIDFEYEHGDTVLDLNARTAVYWERGGWSRNYRKTFEELRGLAERFGFPFDENADPRAIAEVATRLIMADNLASHGLPTTNAFTK